MRKEKKMTNHQLSWQDYVGLVRRPAWCDVITKFWVPKFSNQTERPLGWLIQHISDSEVKNNLKELGNLQKRPSRENFNESETERTRQSIDDRMTWWPQRFTDHRSGCGDLILSLTFDGPEKLSMQIGHGIIRFSEGECKAVFILPLQHCQIPTKPVYRLHVGQANETTLLTCKWLGYPGAEGLIGPTHESQTKWEAKAFVIACIMGLLKQS